MANGLYFSPYLVWTYSGVGNIVFHTSGHVEPSLNMLLRNTAKHSTTINHWISQPEHPDISTNSRTFHAGYECHLRAVQVLNICLRLLVNCLLVALIVVMSICAYGGFCPISENQRWKWSQVALFYLPAVLIEWLITRNPQRESYVTCSNPVITHYYLLLIAI